jgi:dihydroorotate dehydrogenase
MLKFFFRIPGIGSLAHVFFKNFEKSTPINVWGITFPNRVGMAAGFDKNADLFNEMSVFGFGHIEIGTVTPLPQPGNPKPRLFRLVEDQALINRMGFNNAGVDVAVEHLKKREHKLIIGGNIGKNTSTPNEEAYKDYLYCFEKLYDYVDYFVVNVSCPNISDLSELQDKEQLTVILSKLVESRSSKDIKKPILVKISPDLNFQQIDDTLSVINATKIDGVVVSNTSIRRDMLKTNKDKVEAIGKGGLSGLPLRDISTKIISYISEKTRGKLPIIGVGGIMSRKDALEKIEAGASLIQIYTGFIYEGPFIVKKINKFLAKEIKSR